MSNLYGSGGSRDNGRRLYGARTIAHACKQALKGRDHETLGKTSIADQAHAGTREQQRRLRQAERRAKK